MKLIGLLLAAALANLALPSSARANEIYRMDDAQVGSLKDGAKGGNLVYYGGPVISNAKVYAIFWGDKVAAETQSGIGAFLTNMLDSVYMDWLSEYNTNLRAVDGRPGTNQKIGRGTFNGAITIKPAKDSKKVTDESIRQELVAQIAAGKLPAADDNSLYMVYFPSGHTIDMDGRRSCQQFCAYHQGFKTAAGASIFYGVMPACNSRCGGTSNAFDGQTIVSSHEVIEAITDPFPTPGDNPAYPQAWNTTSGEEISDLCSRISAPLAGHGVVSKVQAQWRNSTSSCYNGPWQSRPAAGFINANLRARPIPTLLTALHDGAVCWD
jgi:hypothetical protein